LTLALIVALPFMGALLASLSIRAGRTFCAATAGSVTAIALLLLAFQGPAVLSGQTIVTRISWLPTLGLNANLMLDGLGLLFAGMILGIGLLVIIYARFYLAASDPMGRFFAFIMLFQGAMVGIVLSDNILLLLIFWELTSLSSFLLIGYWTHLPEGRQGARMALTVTGAGGLAMIAGMLILGNIAGSYDLSVILTARDAIQASDWYLPALLLILIGAFTKSAQFPFHFWLPHAMAAPTPVSAYLHSATMVKAGIFLLARMWPVLSGTDAWFIIVTTTGLATMLLGAKVALFKSDLKALLAYSTISHLGLVTMLLGMGTKAAAAVAIFHIINHATFKAALFMTAGIVDHGVHSRDLSRLGGLRHLMPLTFAIAAISALSMAGLPPFNGFLSKELMLEEAAHTTWFNSPWLLGVLATVGALLSVGYSFRFLSATFFGPARDDYPHHPHDPGFGLWVAPAILAALVIIIGVAPMTSVGWLVDSATSAVTGAPYSVKITHWHGLDAPALWMSIIAVGGGLMIVGLFPSLARLWERAARPDAKRMFDAVIEPFAALSQRVTDALHDGALTRFLAIATLAIVAAGLWAFSGGSHLPGTRTATDVPLAVGAGFVILATAVIAIILLHRDRLLSLVLVGVIGLFISVGFAWFAAPDLALTQIAVEVVTVLLMLIALRFLPARTPQESSLSRKLRDGAVAGIAGVAAASLTYALMLRDAAFPVISEFHLAQSKPGAGGTNAVNTIIVDFRGYDTYGEIIVLGIAALVIYALTEVLLAPGRANTRLTTLRPNANRAGDRHPIMMVVATRFLLPIAMMVGVFIFLRGHNMPGGGFVAGLIFAIALLLQYIASGFAWTEARQRVSYHAIIGSGMLIAGVAGAGAWLFGLPFLTSGFEYVTLWPLEKFELATAAIFDLGVFLTVLGAVMLALSSLSRFALRSGERTNTKAFDIDPSRGVP
jgi:multicomponent K+:H+ antiporter subunit A